MLVIKPTASELGRKMSTFLCAHTFTGNCLRHRKKETMRILNHRLLLGEENPCLRILQGEVWTGDNETKLKFILENYFFLRETPLLILLGDLVFVLKVQKCSESSVEHRAQHKNDWRKKDFYKLEERKISASAIPLDSWGFLLDSQTWPWTQRFSPPGIQNGMGLNWALHTQPQGSTWSSLNQPACLPSSPNPS